MSYTIYRVDKTSGEKTVIGCTDDICEIGVIMDDDKDKIDWEADYKVESDAKGVGK